MSRDTRLREAAELFRTGHLPETRALVDAILTDTPDDVDAKHLLGVIALNEGAVVEAERLLTEVVTTHPELVIALYNLGNTILKSGRHSEALARFDQALALRPKFVEALVNRGIALQGLGREEEAIESYDRALNLKPESFEAWFARGNALRSLRRWHDADASFRAAIEKRPDFPEAWNNRGIVLTMISGHKEALTCFDRALDLKPDFWPVMMNRGQARASLSQFAEARADLLRVSAAEPGREGIELKLFMAESHLCIWDRHAEIMQRVRSGALSPSAVCTPWEALYLPLSPHERRSHAAAYVARQTAADRKPLGPYGNRKIRVGYVSSDLRSHATAYLLTGVLEKHDRNRFEIVAFSLGPPPVGDPQRTRIEAAVDAIEDLHGLTDQASADLMRARQIDIAVDLNGHSGGARMGIFARGVAPVQATYLGFPGTTGAPFMDYVIADRYVIPEGERTHFTEKVVYLPDTYQPTDDTRQIASVAPSREALGLPDAATVFACFNHTYKITPEMLDIWARIVKAVEGSVLWLLESSPVAAENLGREAAARGLSPDRLRFAKVIPPAQHLARIAAADLFLDTLPCNAHTTASDALWAGVPVVTCTGDTFAGRVAASLLHAADLAELVTTSLAEYEQLACALGRDRARREGMRKAVQAARTSSALFNTQRMARHLEQAYETMHGRAVRGDAPESFAVQPIATG